MTESDEIRVLREEIKDLTMRLSAIKVITSKVSPVCSEKLRKMMEECEGCKGENE